MKNKTLINRLLGISFYALLPAVFCGCGGAKIEQKIEETSCIRKESRIVTDVVICNWDGSYKTIEWQSWLIVPNDKVDSVKKAEYNKAIPVWEAAKNCR